MRSLDRAGRLAREQRPILVFPEGTRSPDGRLLPFKKGAFAMARDLALPVVPLACVGGRDRLRPGSMVVRPGEMTIRVGRPIAPPHPAYESRAALLAAVRGEIERLLEQGAAA
jgi:1-acyl-sn-glycerol-3-phosphate acyltransferase